MPRKHRVVDHIVEHLAAIGIDHIFGVDGANIEDLYDAAHFHPGITAVLAKHEFSAATMADGYSRSGAGLGVVAATSGGGALNLVAGLGEALASRVPVLALVGQTPTPMDGLGSFQDTSGRNGSLDAEAVFSAVSLSCERVLNPADIVTALPRAIAAARTGGPSVLLLPKDIQQGYVEIPDIRANRNGHPGGELRPIGNPHAIATVLRNANGPVTIIVGEQVARDNARVELEALRAVLRARVATVPDAKDAGGTPGFGSSSALGVTGVMGHPGVAEAAAASAVCLVVGTRLSVTARTGLDDVLARVRTLSIGSAQPYLPCTHVHTDDLRGTLRMLTQALSGRGRPMGLRVPDVVRHTELKPPPYAGTGVRYRDAMAVLDGALPDGTDVVVDAGNTGASAVHYLPARRGGRFAVALGMGGMGYSFGAGIGMAFGRANSGRTRRAHGGDRRGRRVFHARHGGAHRGALPAPGDVRVVQQQRPRHVRDPRAAVLRRPLQLQPISFQPAGCRSGDDVPGPDVRRRQRPRRVCRRDARGTGCRRPGGGQRGMRRRRNPAVRTVSQRAASENDSHSRDSNRKGEPDRCRCQRLRISPPKSKG